MIKSLLSLWKNGSSMPIIVNDFLSMLVKSRLMMELSLKAINDSVDVCKDELEIIYRTDKEINNLKRKIIKQVLIHIQMHPPAIAPFALSLISISKDAERIGDYVKNIIELKNIKGDGAIDYILYNQLFVNIGNSALDLFSKAAKAFEESDRDLALDVIKTGRSLAHSCENINEQAIQDDIKIQEGAIIILGARYIKRICLHLANISSSIVNPLTEIDFY